MARGRPPNGNTESGTPTKKAETKSRTARAEKAGTKAGLLTIEAELWAMADKLRGSMDAALYKHVALGRCF